MDVALVEDRQDHIHHEDGQAEEEDQLVHHVAEDLGVALELGAEVRRDDLGGGLLGDGGGEADGDAGEEVEGDRHRGEAVDVVDRLRAEHLLHPGDRAERHQRPVLRGDVEEPEVVGHRPVAVLHLEDHLVLVVGLLDQVDVILRVGRPDQRFDLGHRDPVFVRLVAEDLDLQARRAPVEIGLDAEEEGIGPQLRRQLLGGVVDLVRIDPGDRVGILPLVLAGGVGGDLQHRIGPDEGHHPGNPHQLHGQLLRHGLDRLPLGGIGEELPGQPHVGGEALREPGEGEEPVDVGIVAQDVVDLFLVEMHLLGRAPLLGDEDADREAAVAHRQEGRRDHKIKADRADNTGDPYHPRNPAVP